MRKKKKHWPCNNKPKRRFGFLEDTVKARERYTRVTQDIAALEEEAKEARETAEAAEEAQRKAEAAVSANREFMEQKAERRE